MNWMYSMQSSVDWSEDRSVNSIYLLSDLIFFVGSVHSFHNFILHATLQIYSSRNRSKVYTTNTSITQATIHMDCLDIFCNLKSPNLHNIVHTDLLTINRDHQSFNSYIHTFKKNCIYTEICWNRLSFTQYKEYVHSHNLESTFWSS